MHFELRWRSWHGDEPLTLDFPERYRVAVYPPHDAPDWKGVLRALEADHLRGGTAAVFPCGAIQFAPFASWRENLSVPGRDS